MKFVTDIPIKFIGIGEKIDEFDIFLKEYSNNAEYPDINQ